MSDYARAAMDAEVLTYLFWEGTITQDEINAVARRYVGCAPSDDYPMYPSPPGFAPPPPVNLTMPVAVSAKATVGDTLHCTDGTWQGAVSFAYQWRRGATPVGSNANYTTGGADAGQNLACLVTATNPSGSTPGPLSNAIQVTAPADPPDADDKTKAKAKR
jgi:hypothetical protein